MDNLKTAFLFPGQGSQYPGMAKKLYQNSAIARHVFEEADEALGYSLSKLILEGPEAELRRTAVTQPAILTASIAYYRVLADKGFLPQAAAGHSLGEFTALVAAEALDLKAACQLVELRGKLMQSAVPEGLGGMAALTGATEDQAQNLLAAVRKEMPQNVLEISARNCPGQIVLSGHTTALEKAVELARGLGILKATLLNVSAPFHCSLLKTLEKELGEAFIKQNFCELNFPYVANATGEWNQKPSNISRLLIAQICSPVEWESSIRKLWESGVRNFIEVGPGRVLTALVKRTLKAVAEKGEDFFLESVDEEADLAPEVLRKLASLR